jgi:hypothetical protein
MCVPEEQLPMEDMDAKDNLSYQEYPVKILETFERGTQNLNLNHGGFEFIQSRG